MDIHVYIYTQLYIVCVRKLLMRRRQMGTATHGKCISSLHPHEVLMIMTIVRNLMTIALTKKVMIRRRIWSELIIRQLLISTLCLLARYRSRTRHDAFDTDIDFRSLYKFATCSYDTDKGFVACTRVDLRSSYVLDRFSFVFEEIALVLRMS